MEQVDFTTESIHPKTPISQVHIHRRSRHNGPPSSFANTRWGREEIAGRHIYLADGTYVRRPRRRRHPAPPAFPNITLQESVDVSQSRDVSLSSSLLCEPVTSKPKSSKFNPAHIFSWPVPHPLRSSPISHHQSVSLEPSNDGNLSSAVNDAENLTDRVQFKTVVREPPRVPTLRHERRPLNNISSNRRSSDNRSLVSSSSSLSTRSRAPSSLGTPSVSYHVPSSRSPAISPTSFDQENALPAGVSADLRSATAAAIRQTDEQAQIRFSPPPALPVFGSVGGRSRKRRHHSSSSSSSGAWPTNASSTADPSLKSPSSPSRTSGLVLWLGVLFRRRSRHQHSRRTLDCDTVEAEAYVETVEPPPPARSSRRRRSRRKRRKDDGCDTF